MVKFNYDWHPYSDGPILSRQSKKHAKVDILSCSFASKAKRNRFVDDLKELVRNKNYLTIFFTLTFVFGDLSIIFVFLPWITKTYHYEMVSNGIVVGCANLAGLVGCVIVSLFGKKYTYRQKCIGLSVGMVVSISLLWLTL